MRRSLDNCLRLTIGTALGQYCWTVELDTVLARDDSQDAALADDDRSP